MAEIVQSLFGITPESYRATQQQQADAQALQYAKLDPFQQANFAIGRGATMLGGAIGGALGGQDPELQRITMRQQIARQLNPNDPASIEQGISALSQAGDSQGAMMLQAEYRKLVESRALVGQREASALASTAQATRERTQAVPNDIQIARELANLEETLTTLTAMPKSPERDIALRRVSTQLANLRNVTAKPGEKAPAANIKEIGVAIGTNKPVLLDVNNDQQFTYGVDASGKQVRVPFTGGVDRTTAKTSVTSTQVQESEFAKQLGGEQSKRYSGAVTLRDNAVSAVKTFNELARLDDQGLVSGTFATGRVGATNLLNTLGLIGNADVGKLARSENYQKIAGDAILATLGGKLGAGFSNEDRKFIQGLVPQLENSPVARRQLIDYMLRKNNEIVAETNRLIDYAETKRTLNGFKPAIPLAVSTTNRYSNMSDEELNAAIAAAKTKK
jgi:hypothetical protein